LSNNRVTAEELNSSDFFARVTLGLVRGVSSVFKFGFQLAQPSVNERPVWDETTEVPYLSSPDDTVTVSSDNANDAEGGSGAEAVEVHYLDGDWRLQETVITLNGQTGVTIPTPVLRVLRAFVVRGDTAAGEIYVGYGAVTAGVPANILAHITNGEEQTLMAIYTVPKGFTGLMYSLAVGSAGNTTRFLTVRVRSRRNLRNEPFRTQNKFIVGGGTKNLLVFRESLIPYEAGTDIEIRAIANTGTLDAEAQFELLLFDEDIWQ
jgi:hypothetical protein